MCLHNSIYINSPINSFYAVLWFSVCLITVSFWLISVVRWDCLMFVFPTVQTVTLRVKVFLVRDLSDVAVKVDHGCLPVHWPTHPLLPYAADTCVGLLPPGPAPPRRLPWSPAPPPTPAARFLARLRFGCFENIACTAVYFNINILLFSLSFLCLSVSLFSY